MSAIFIAYQEQYMGAFTPKQVRNVVIKWEEEFVIFSVAALRVNIKETLC